MILGNEEDTASAGAALARVARAGDVLTLSGPLGVGKTALARGFIAARGHAGEVPSPSFAIVQPYDALDPPVWHVDLYRIEKVSDLEELGLEDIREEGVLIVEWPEHAGPDIWAEALALSLQVGEDGARALTAGVPTSWEGRWPLR